MTGLFFLDTNILIYAAKAKEDEPEKCAVANRILQEESFCVSAQVLQEFFVASQRSDPKRPLAVPLAERQAAEWVGWLEPFCEVSTDALLVQDAIEAARRHRISYWDAAILVAATRAEAPVVYTEDLNHGQRYGKVEVLNPFRPS
jgi:predicted nucleic acid-binding protein